MKGGEKNMEEQKKIVIERVFDAPREKVWEAWTTQELVKQWWGPKDFTAPSVQIDFTVGGKYIYAMHGPKGSEWDKDMYSAGVYKEIIPLQKLVVTDYFSDAQGNKKSPTEHGLPTDMPEEMEVTVLFEDLADGKTKLSIVYTPESEVAYNAMIRSGIQEGWGTSLDKMAKLVEG